MNTTAITWERPAPTRRTLLSEWTKLSTLRSTWITLTGSAVLSIVLAVIVAASQLSQWDSMSPAQRADFDPIATSLVGVLFVTVIVGALGVKAVTGEIATGMTHVTLTATPRRVGVLVAKAVVAALVGFPAALAANALSFLAGQAVLADQQLDVGLGEPGAARAIVFGTIAVSLVAALGVGLGALLRRTAFATTLLSVAIVGSQLFAIALPAGARPYLPGSALQAAVSRDALNDADLLTPGAGLATLAAYTVLVLGLAVLVAHREDR